MPNHKINQDKVLSLVEQIHAKALEVSRSYLKSEGELIEILQSADQHRVYLEKGYSSLFLYVVKGLNLSESVAYNLISVSRKARDVPELKTAIQTGAITLSNARKITPIVNDANKAEWLEKAATLSNRQLEKEVVKVFPKAATPEKVSYITESRVALNFGLPENEMLKVRRVQDLLSQAKKRALSLEEVLIELSHEYLRRHDPVSKAKRSIVRKGTGIEQSDVKPVTLQVHPERKPVPALVFHQVSLRDQRRCTHQNDQGIRCNQSRFIEVHHQVPVSEGGQNTVSNLITLCSAHHRHIHRQG